ncbi:MAG: DUF4398 domain-containing protein [Bdellovibrionaceae bacterium]|nr:DUF4398 domain-containing protein [Pseudobdellovibrionaceae bacterium]
MIKRLLFIGLLSCFFIVGCQTVEPPVEEWVLARAAFDSARAVQAAKYSAGFWHQAEESYKKARVLYKEESFDEARLEFIEARKAAEKAENSARLKRFRSGEVL